MIYVFIGMSLLFVAIGFMVTENNAQYLLAGYNTMSPEERKQFDLKSFIPFFRKFHLFLGISFLAIGLALYYLGSAHAGGIFLGLYPISAYVYFTWKANTFSKGLNTKWTKAVMYVLAGTFVFVFGLLGLGFKEDKLMVDAEKIRIEGSYGEEITSPDIALVTLTAE
jgi:hypothetical protein